MDGNGRIGASKGERGGGTEARDGMGGCKGGMARKMRGGSEQAWEGREGSDGKTGKGGM